ncbi:hypothetical protein GUJ93_ZPchr0010g10971 [Zizania palustris]|uniref:Myb/SANT-like domain-containing protein n=1 Tax=Zizania palustris TaxID=103762 RepID=A0A8J5W7R1_ZIZPA|nr:hypothetical protein GUJ93_ZPchr0010g10971 [Zizania palustris]
MSRNKTFDKHHTIINGMLETSGFGWDWNKNKISVDSDSVWEAYVAAMDKVKKSGRGYTSEIDEALLTTFVEFYNKGDHAQNGWNSHVYTAAVKNVCDKCGVDITKDNIIS